MDKKSITKSNAMIEAGYRLTLTEMQIILYGISLINPTQKEFPLTYSINISKFAQMFNKQHKQIYGEIKEVIKKRFWERDFSYSDSNGDIVTLRWLTQIKHNDKTGLLEIEFSQKIQPYLHQLQKRFTCYYLDQIIKMKSIYSVRFYEFAIMELKQTKLNKTTFILPINEIRLRLELTEKYKRFANFKARVLEKAKKEINEFSNIKLNYKVTKLNKTPLEIKFTASYRNPEKQEEDQLPLLENDHINLSPSIIEQAKQIATEANTHWDIYAIIEQFKAYARQKGMPDNINGAFLGFVKKKITNVA